MKEKAIILLSAGLDSTVNLYEAKLKYSIPLVLTFDYGQRASNKEVEKARNICSELELTHKVTLLPWLTEITATSLVNPDVEVPVRDGVQINDLKQSEETAKAVWVPNRNGIFLNIAAAYAESLGSQYIIPGFNIEEATTFPDNSEDFLKALDQSFYFSTATRVKTKCFTTRLSKTDIVRRGRELNVNFDMVWPCYFGGEKMCGECESCQRYLRAMEDA